MADEQVRQPQTFPQSDIIPTNEDVDSSENVPIDDTKDKASKAAAKAKALQRFDNYLNLVTMRRLTDQHTLYSQAEQSDAAKAVSKMIERLKPIMGDILDAFEQHYDGVMLASPSSGVTVLEPEQFIRIKWDTIMNAIQPGATFYRAASADIDVFKNQMDSLVSADAYVAQQRSDAKKAISEGVGKLVKQLERSIQNPLMFPAGVDRETLDLAQVALQQLQKELPEAFVSQTALADPIAFMNQMVAQGLAEAFIGTGIAVPVTNAVDAVNAIVKGVQQAGADKTERTRQTAVMKAQEAQQAGVNQGQVKTIADIRKQFPDRPDLAMKAEIGFRNALMEDPKADPNVFVQQFAGQAEGEKRIAQGLFDAGLDTESLSPAARKAVMEKGFTAETLPDLVASLPGFKTQFPTAAQFGAKEIADSIIKKALAEQPGNPMLSITAQLQPSPTNPNAAITPAYATGITKIAEQTGFSPTGLAQAFTGDYTSINAQQSGRNQSPIDSLYAIGKKFGVDQKILEEEFMKYGTTFAGEGEGYPVPQYASTNAFNVIKSNLRPEFQEYGSFLDEASKRIANGFGDEPNRYLSGLASSLPDVETEYQDFVKKKQQGLKTVSV